MLDWTLLKPLREALPQPDEPGARLMSRYVIVTSVMHKVHRSDWHPEMVSNYSTVLSIWDRLAMTFRMRPDPNTSVFGLQKVADSSWQT